MAEKKKKNVKWFWEKEPDEFERMHELLHEIGEPFVLRSGFGPGQMKKMKSETIAPVDISETDRDIIVRAELPGFKKDDVKLVVTKETFELSAEKKHEEIERSETFYRKEVGRRAIHRTFTLPASVDVNRVSARLEEGILTVIMPKLESQKKKKKSVEIE